MIYLTQLVYLRPGQEATFAAFEDTALGLLGKHGGELVLRLRPDAASVIACSGEVPYEVHVVRFPTDQEFEAFAADPERVRALPLKDGSVRRTLLVRGSAA